MFTLSTAWLHSHICTSPCRPYAD